MYNTDGMPRFRIVHHHSSHPTDTCQHCGHPVQLCDGVGWVDTTVPYLGGTYDMCSNSRSGAHDPQADLARTRYLKY